MTSTHSIVFGNSTEQSDTILGYGLGWGRFSLAGHDVFATPYRWCVRLGCRRRSLFPSFVDTLANADEKRPALHDITLAVLRKLAGYTDESLPPNLPPRPWTRFQSATTWCTTCSRGRSVNDPRLGLARTTTTATGPSRCAMRRASRTNASSCSTISVSRTSHQRAT